MSDDELSFIKSQLKSQSIRLEIIEDIIICNIPETKEFFQNALRTLAKISRKNNDLIVSILLEQRADAIEETQHDADR